MRHINHMTAHSAQHKQAMAEQTCSVCGRVVIWLGSERLRRETQNSEIVSERTECHNKKTVASPASIFIRNVINRTLMT